jgi:uncharacterized protein
VAFVVTWLQYLGVGLAVGALSGLLGVGGGIIMVPMIIYLWKTDMKVAVGTSLATMILTAAAGSLKHFTLGNVNVNLALCLAVGAVLGTVFIGAPLANVLPDATLKKVFAGFMILTALQMLGVFDAVGKLFARA